MKYSHNIASISFPPNFVFPLTQITSIIPSSIVKSETSKVPPPKSNIINFFSSFSIILSKLKAIEAAVGSLIKITSSNPAILAADIVASF